MKARWVLLFCIAFFSACKKDKADNSEPIVMQDLVGNYLVYEVENTVDNSHRIGAIIFINDGDNVIGRRLFADGGEAPQIRLENNKLEVIYGASIASFNLRMGREEIDVVSATANLQIIMHNAVVTNVQDGPAFRGYTFQQHDNSNSFAKFVGNGKWDWRTSLPFPATLTRNYTTPVFDEAWTGDGHVGVMVHKWGNINEPIMLIQNPAFQVVPFKRMP